MDVPETVRGLYVNTRTPRATTSDRASSSSSSSTIASSPILQFAWIRTEVPVCRGFEEETDRETTALRVREPWRTTADLEVCVDRALETSGGGGLIDVVRVEREERRRGERDDVHAALARENERGAEEEAMRAFTTTTTEVPVASRTWTRATWRRLFAGRRDVWRRIRIGRFADAIREVGSADLADVALTDVSPGLLRATTPRGDDEERTAWRRLATSLVRHGTVGTVAPSAFRARLTALDLGGIADPDDPRADLAADFEIALADAYYNRTS